ncbi:pili assembly chaperone [Stigmatella sp. ncwal1]|uniref:Pili assembly chaperone n=1 Tax=Stigmatella ashevillensis TaxID=2995309 RepID=A0ABT5DIH0_9BACT|nr:pili assembly chaperone [Stigmatella ashevillena]MDC0712933.1 pili assembly chaperone [Stigmatella ashevillena]
MISSGRRGFTFVEGLIVLSMTAVLAAIAVPTLLRAQARAKHSEVITNLKSLHASLTAQPVKPASIHADGFALPRGNRYSYHAGTPCTSWEDRSTRWPIGHETDDCIGVDTYARPFLPELFTPVEVAAAQWDLDGTVNGMTTGPGFFGSELSWDYIVAAAGDRDYDLSDVADTWWITSAEGLLFAPCQNSPVPFSVVAGEPFLVHDDVECDF